MVKSGRGAFEETFGKLSAAEKQRVARAALVDNLEFDATGMLPHAGLTFDQRVAYSVAMSLKCISDNLEKHVLNTR